MIKDTPNLYRDLLEQDPPAFFDRVNTPWDEVPDLEDYNKVAYTRVLRALRDLKRSEATNSGCNSQGLLILGEAGTGKTHLLMRVARNLSQTNHILFIRKPNNEEAVAQHIWANVVSSLARTLPMNSSSRSQLDDLLAHVFSRVLIPEFEKDIVEGKDAEQKQRWVNRLQEDPFSLFKMLGDGERRQDNMERIRRRTLRFLQINHPDVDQTIAHVLITYCFVLREDRKRVLLNWLAGQDVDETEAKDLGLPTSWITLEETSTEASVSQQREEQALRAIRTVGILSTYYQPLILAFDQLEGLRNQERLTRSWGDVVREIFTMAPNFLVITCIFPSLWDTWFLPTLDQSVSERIAQQLVTLETFTPHHGLKMLATHLAPSFEKHRLPTNIFPFSEVDVDLLCQKAMSPRTFLQKARSEFQVWLDGGESELSKGFDVGEELVSQEQIDELLRSTLLSNEVAQRALYDSEVVIEMDFFGRIRNLAETSLIGVSNSTRYRKATYSTYVMPPNVVLSQPDHGESLCIAVMNSEGNSFAARIKNLMKCLEKGGQFDRLLIIRDRRSKRLGKKSQEYVDEARSKGTAFVDAATDEVSLLNAIYETCIAVEEHDLVIGSHEVSQTQLVAFLRSEKILNRSEFFNQLGRLYKPFSGNISPPSIFQPIDKAKVPAPEASKAPSEAPKSTNPKHLPPSVKGQSANGSAKMLIGDARLGSPHAGIIGILKDGGQKVAISLTKPQCLVLLGYMGSGKSYALGVLIENALLSQPQLIEQTRPMAVVAFNYRRNPQARFEYGGFAHPNSKEAELEVLTRSYGAQPAAVKMVNVFGYEEELNRRSSEYGSLRALPIKFRPDELGAEHWEILMKPPTKEAEYMDIIRDIIQRLYYQERLNFKNLELALHVDERLSSTQRRKAMTRLSFAERWIADDRPYEWGEVLSEGSLNIFDLRMQAMEESEALKLCLIITDLVRRTKNGVNKVVVFDEAHEYVDSKELVGDLENALTQIRHDGLSFILASQFPERIPERIFKYLLTRLVFKLPTQKAINYVRNAAPNLEGLSPQRVANLGLEKGLCFIQTDDDCSDPLLRVPQAIEIRPRLTLHGGATVRQDSGLSEITSPMTNGSIANVIEDGFDDSEALSCPYCGQELHLRSRSGNSFMVCRAYPTCQYTKSIDHLNP